MQPFTADRLKHFHPSAKIRVRPLLFSFSDSVRQHQHKHSFLKKPPFSFGTEWHYECGEDRLSASRGHQVETIVAQASCAFILPYIMPSVRGYERCHNTTTSANDYKCVRSEMNMPDRKPKDGGVDGFLLYRKFPNINSFREQARLAINTTADNIQHRAISSSIHYIYFPSYMSSQGQCTIISARSSSDGASVNASSFICLQSATASL
jgi:hypothetical protein